MTEQERPRTEAAWLPDAVAYVREEFPMAVEAIVEAARTEGRQQAERVLDRVLASTHGPNLGSGSNYRHCACPVHAPAFEMVAGLNASESPPIDCSHAQDCICVDTDHGYCCGTRRAAYLGAASDG